MESGFWECIDVVVFLCWYVCKVVVSNQGKLVVSIYQ